MSRLRYNDLIYDLDYAVKGPDYIHGYDEKGNRVVAFESITDFSAFDFESNYTAPEACMHEKCNNVKHVNGELVREDGAPVGIINDNAFGDAAWSSRNILATFCKPLRLSGESVSFANTLVNYPMDISVYYPMVSNNDSQPNPDNIVSVDRCGLHIWKCGTNLLRPDGTLPTNKNGVTFTRRNDGSIAVNGDCTASFSGTVGSCTLPAGTYTVSFGYKDNDAVTGQLHKVMPNGTHQVLDPYIGEDYSYTFTLTETTQIRVVVYCREGGSCNVVIRPQIEIGDTATVYAQFVGSGDYSTIELGEAADNFGAGTIQLLSGDVTVEHYKLVLTGAEEWTAVNATHNPNGHNFMLKVPYRGSVSIDSGACSHYPWLAAPYTSNMACGMYPKDDNLVINNASVPTGTYLLIADPRFTSVADFVEYLAEQYAAGTPVTVLYKLLQRIVMRGNTLAILPNASYNILTVPGGTIYVESYLDPKATIDGLTERVKQLEAAISSV